MKTQKQQQWFSILFAIAVILIASTMSLYLLSFIIPYSRSVKGLENSTKSYYLWRSAIEQSLWSINQNVLWYEASDGFVWPSDYSFDIIAMSDLIPQPWLWNSNFDTDWNTISFWNPLQLSVGDNLISNWSVVDFDFRVPDLNGNGSSTDQTVFGGASTIILSWQLSSSTNTLLPTNTGSFITASDINSLSTFDLSSRPGVDLAGLNPNFASFYGSECTTWPCILKISVLWNMFLNDVNRTSIPYLEYAIDTGWQDIPTRFTNIQATWWSYGFRKSLDVRIPQLTTDQAFDFAVFQ